MSSEGYFCVCDQLWPTTIVFDSLGIYEQTGSNEGDSESERAARNRVKKEVIALLIMLNIIFIFLGYIVLEIESGKKLKFNILN